MSLRATVRDALVIGDRGLVVVLENGFDGHARKGEEVDVPLKIGGTKRLRIRAVEIADVSVSRRESYVALLFGLEELSADEIARGAELRSAETVH